MIFFSVRTDLNAHLFDHTKVRADFCFADLGTIRHSRLLLRGGESGNKFDDSSGC